ncbi:carboxypeptidase regulatory-like domain-containing protein [Microbacterium rhizophilus]|uniref:carboxypeptidase regulatory-like domain-containing protein n=1 Tax=Microbacterium rhizophilus TaxID=3138934 RepID=UPI0031E9F878
MSAVLRGRFGRYLSLLVVGFLLASGFSLQAAPAHAAATGTISGVVTLPDGSPADDVQLDLYRVFDEGDGARSEWVDGMSTDALGRYAFGRLEAGAYRLYVSAGGNVITGWWGGGADESAAHPIPLTAGEQLSGIDVQLEAGATISGQVTSDDGQAIADVEVRAYAWREDEDYAEGGYFSGAQSVYTGEDGRYAIQGLSEGSYTLRFRDYNGGNVAEWWGDVAEQADATRFTVGAGSDLTSYDATLARAAKISGRVTSADGAGIGGVEVAAYVWREDEGYDEGGYFSSTQSASTDEDGRFTVGSLSHGSYTLRFDDYNGEYVSEWWGDVAEQTDSVRFDVEAGVDLTGYDATLVRAGRISGFVALPSADASGYVDLYRLDTSSPDYQAWLDGDSSDGSPLEPPMTSVNNASVDSESGSYEFGGLAAGSYLVQFSAWDQGSGDPLLGEWWQGAQGAREATPVVVEPGATTSSIDGEIRRGGTISGFVLHPDGSAPASGEVYLVDRAGIEIATDWISDQPDEWSGRGPGEFRFSAVPAGDYTLRFTGDGIVPSFYGPASDESQAEYISVTEGGVVDLGEIETLQPGRITGVVTDPAGDPVAGAWVELGGVEEEFPQAILEGAGGGNGQTEADESGRFVIENVIPGRYTIKVRGDGFASQWLGGVNDWSDVETFFDVEPGATTTQDVALQGGIAVTAEVVGAPAGWTTANLVDRQGNQRAWTQFDQSGEIRFEGVVPGTYTLWFQSDDDAIASQYLGGTAELSRARTFTVPSTGFDLGRVELAPTAGVVTGRVTDDLGAPIRDAYVFVMPSAAGDENGRAGLWTDAQGYYRVPLLSGDYTVRADAWTQEDGSGYATRWLGGAMDSAEADTFSLTGDTTLQTIVLPRHAVLTGVARNLAGMPMSDIQVSVNTADGYGYKLFTDADGTFRLTHLDPGVPLRVGFRPYSDSEFVEQWWQRAPSEDEATPVNFRPGETESLEFVLLAPGEIETPPLAIEGSQPRISGTPMVGETLTAEAGAWSPAGVTFAYEWLRDGEAIAGATASTYSLTADDSGKRIAVRVVGSKAGLSDVVEQSEQTDVIAPATLASAVPTVTGSATVGATLTAVAGAWTTGTAFVYQWLADDVAIAGATKSTHVLTVAEAGKKISVEVSGSKAGYAPASRKSVQTAAVVLPALTTAVPTITGAVTVGSTLTAVTGTWTTGTAFAYQWLADGVAITGATGGTYALSATDAGKKITVTVSGSKVGYAPASKTSAPTDAVALATLTAAVPTITGAITVGSTLTAVTGTWTTGTAFTYQWFADDVVIAGATKATYALTAADAGKKISVEVAGSKAGYAPASKKSVQTAAVTLLTLTTATPTITGTTTVGSTLTAVTGMWTTGATFAYRWLADDAAISGATASTYVLTAADAGKKISVEVSGSKTGYAPASKKSAQTAAVALPSLTAATPTITGTTTVGSTLTAKPGTWTTGTAFAYQWLRDGTAISGATASTYTLTASDAGKKISVTVTGSKIGYASAPKNSTQTAGITLPALAAATPTITGTVKVGSTLTAKAGTWTTGTAFTYQWLRNGVAITGATKSTYVLTASDGSKKISVKVTGSKSGYTSVAKTSAQTAAVALLTLTAPTPTITGTTKVGSTLTAKAGTWTSGTTLTYQWLRDGKSITGATKSAYKLTTSDAARKVSVKVTGSKAGYATAAKTSKVTAAVTPATLTAATPTISGTTKAGYTLTAKAGTWTSGATLKYQWLRDGKAISGATRSTYKLTSTDRAHKITVKVTGSKTGYTTVSKTSAAKTISK